MPDDQFQYVKLPDGSYGKFSQSAADGDIRAAVQKDFPKADFGAGLTDNSKGEGTYRLVAPDVKGTYTAIPFSRVQDAQAQGYKFQDTAQGDRWHKDYQATLSLPNKLQDRYDYGTRDVASDGSDSDGNVVKAAVQNVGGHAGKTIIKAALHPLDTAGDMLSTAADVANPLRIGPPQFVKDAYHYVLNNPDHVAAVERLLGDAGGNLLLGEGAGAATSGLTPHVDGVNELPTAVSDRAAGMVRGGKVDEVIPGDTVTPGQRYEQAKAMGVNLDLAQATNGAGARMAKTVSEPSLLGKAAYEQLQTANRAALNSHATNVLDGIAPELSREDLGTSVQQALRKDQAGMSADASEIYENLDRYMGHVKPDLSNVQALSKGIVDDNRQYFADNPDALRGGTRTAWNIVNRLADGKGSTGWSDLHKFRTDLLDLTRGPEMVGDRAAGWLKQVTAAVDNSMTKPSTMDPLALDQFREANDVYGHMKQLYDNPQSRFYQMARATDGTKVSQFLDAMTPEEFRHVSRAAPELVPAIRRYTMEKMLSPAGNGVPEWSTLTSRFVRAQKEGLAAKLAPEHLQSMEAMARVSRTINENSNPSGTAKLVVPAGEMYAAGKGAVDIASGAFAGDPMRMLSGAKDLAAPLVNRAVAKSVTNPATVDRVMRGPDAWADRGAAKLKGQISDAQIEALRGTKEGRQILMHAGDLGIGSKAYKAVVQAVKRGWGGRSVVIQGLNQPERQQPRVP